MEPFNPFWYLIDLIRVSLSAIFKNITFQQPNLSYILISASFKSPSIYRHAQVFQRHFSTFTNEDFPQRCLLVCIFIQHLQIFNTTKNFLYTPKKKQSSNLKVSICVSWDNKHQCCFFFHRTKQQNHPFLEVLELYFLFKVPQAQNQFVFLDHMKFQVVRGSSPRLLCSIMLLNMLTI